MWASTPSIIAEQPDFFFFSFFPSLCSGAVGEAQSTERENAAALHFVQNTDQYLLKTLSPSINAALLTGEDRAVNGLKYNRFGWRVSSPGGFYITTCTRPIDSRAGGALVDYACGTVEVCQQTSEGPERRGTSPGLQICSIKSQMLRLFLWHICAFFQIQSNLFGFLTLLWVFYVDVAEF